MYWWRRVAFSGIRDDRVVTEWLPSNDSIFIAEALAISIALKMITAHNLLQFMLCSGSFSYVFCFGNYLSQTEKYPYSTNSYDICLFNKILSFDIYFLFFFFIFFKLLKLCLLFLFLKPTLKHTFLNINILLIMNCFMMRLSFHVC